MGDAKARSRSREEILRGEPRCIYCAGRPETLEHMPPMSMFQARRRPKGLEFASCQACNNETSDADLVASFLARLSPFEGQEGWRDAEIRNMRRALAAQVPKFLHELLWEGKSRKVWMRNARGVLVETVQISTAGKSLKGYLKVFFAKLGMALYREHTGTALPPHGSVRIAFHPNSGPDPKVVRTILERLPAFGTLTQGKFEVSGQFAYRYNTDGRTLLFAYVQFPPGLFGYLLVTSDPEFFTFPFDPLFRHTVVPGELLALMPDRLGENPQ